MTPLLLLVAPGPVVVAQAGEVADTSNALAVYGIAAPFAALCLILAFLFRKERDQARTEATVECDKKDVEIARLHAKLEEQAKEQLQREQQLVAGLGPRIYDAALLYREATGLAEQVATPPKPVSPPAPPVDKRLDELTTLVEQLVKGMGQARE